MKARFFNGDALKELFRNTTLDKFNKDAVLILLSQGPYTHDDLPADLLHYAIAVHSNPLFKIALQNGFDPNKKIEFSSNKKQSPLDVALKYNFPDIIMPLLVAGANVISDDDKEINNNKQNDNETKSLEEKILCWAASEGHINLIKELDSNEALRQRFFKPGLIKKALAAAMYHNKGDCVMFFLNHKHLVIKDLPSHILHWAAATHHLQILEWGIKAGFFPNKSNEFLIAYDKQTNYSYSGTPIELAMETNFPDAIIPLLSKNIKVDEEKILCWAAKEGHLNLINQIAYYEIKAKPRFFQLEILKKALKNAMLYNQEECVLAFLNSGFLTLNDLPSNLLNWAVALNSSKVLHWTLEHGYDPNKKEEVCCYTRGTGVNRIVLKGAHYSFNDHPLKIAMDQGYPDLILPLIAAGAKGYDKEIIKWASIHGHTALLKQIANFEKDQVQAIVMGNATTSNAIIKQEFFGQSNCDEKLLNIVFDLAGVTKDAYPFQEKDSEWANFLNTQSVFKKSPTSVSTENQEQKSAASNTMKN